MSVGLAKAVLVARDEGQIECRFNPTEYTIAKSATWASVPVRGAPTAPTPEFVGTNPGTLQMELLFDDYESGGGDVSRDVEALLSWTSPTARSLQENRPAPPVVFFQWGAKTLFDAYVRSVTARYTMFRTDGTPVRATVAVVFEEVPRDPARQNPTSGGGPGSRSYRVNAGDTLYAVAFRQYGDAAMWRVLAQVNRVDDPLRLRPGATLWLPPRGAPATKVRR